MNTAALPALFVSHGSPMLALEPGAAGAFMQRLGPAVERAFGRPRAIVVVSPHTSARAPIVLGSAAHHAVHDFGGFPRELYELQYSPPGDPLLAADVAARLAAAGIATQQIDDEPGIDHGMWSVLRFAWPDANVPVVPVALAPQQPPGAQWAIGEALAPLAAQGVLVIGSGSITHNLRLLFRAGGQPPLDAAEIAESRAFRDWVAERVEQGDRDGLLDYRARAPHAAYMHPSDEHWLPFYIAAGAGGLEASARLHDSVTYGALGMDAYAFGPGSQALADVLSSGG